MQVFPNYSMSNMPQYIPQGYNPPYMDRLSNLQAMQQQINPVMQQMPMGINGKIVDKLENITANDVPMDGSFAVFPKRDMSEIYIKYWTADGKIATIAFKPNVDSTLSNLTENENKSEINAFLAVLEGVSNKVDILSDKVEEILKQKSTLRAKKEVNSDE